jgi:hypothetical protein
MDALFQTNDHFLIQIFLRSLILKSNWFAILISLRSIFSIPSIKHLCLEILLLNANEDKILTFANASKPFKSNFGFPGSA